MGLGHQSPSERKRGHGGIENHLLPLPRDKQRIKVTGHTVGLRLRSEKKKKKIESSKNK
jgi:hypothetical protein